MQYKWKVVLSISCLIAGLVIMTYLPELLNPPPTSTNPSTTTNGNNDGTSTKNNGGSGNNGVSLTIDFGNGTVHTWSNILLTEPDNSVYNATLQKCPVDYIEYPGGEYFVTGIDGHTSSFWQYWVNGTYPSSACNKFFILSGSTILWNCSH